MKVLDYVILGIIAVCIIIAVIRIKNNKGGCSGDCSNCNSSCKKDK